MRKLLTFLLVLTAFFSAYPQKLPKVQTASVRAPANIKIDGKIIEWGDKFQAYNTATDVYYTLSNDDENLYLALRVKEPYVFDNIIKHGLRFTVNHSTNKKDVSPVIITYPAMTHDDRWAILNLIATRSNEGASKPVNNSAEALNSLLKAKSKFIKVEGISDIVDKEIPLYNDRGITAVSAFEKPFAYVYELAIPLKYLSLSSGGTTAFSYQIKINYPDPNEKRPPQPPPPPNVKVFESLKVSVAITDFSGEYTLAK